MVLALCQDHTEAGCQHHTCVSLGCAFWGHTSEWTGLLETPVRTPVMGVAAVPQGWMKSQEEIPVIYGF